MIETCDRCGVQFEPDESSFIGDLSGDTECHFLTIITCLCAKCAKEHEDDIARNSRFSI